MSIMSRSITYALTAFVCLFNMLVVAVPAAYADDKEIAQAMRAGDLVMVVRHGATFPDQADTDPLNFDNIGAQRNLNDLRTRKRLSVEVFRAFSVSKCLRLT